MAVYVQPYNPWREQLLASFLGPFISDMLGRSRAADMNRKKSAFLGELANQSQPAVDTAMPQGIQSMGEPSLSYSEAAPWAKAWGAGAGGGLMDGAFSNSGNTSPFLQQFDAAVRGAAQPQSRNLSIGDVMRLLSSKRFGMLDPAEMMGLAQPYLNEQAARLADAKRARGLADFKAAVMGQRNPEDLLRELMFGTMDGYLDKGVFKDMVDWNKHANPHMEYRDINLGDRVMSGAFNPRTGEMMKLFENMVRMNPYQREQTDIDWGKLGLDQQKFGEDIRQFDTTHDLKEREFGEEQTQNAFNRELEEKKLRENGGKITDIGKALDKNLQNRIGEAKREIKTIDESLLFLGDPKEKAALKARKAELEAQIEANMRLQWEQMYNADPNNPIVRSMGEINGYLPRNESPKKELKAVDGGKRVRYNPDTDDLDEM